MLPPTEGIMTQEQLRYMDKKGTYPWMLPFYLHLDFSFQQINYDRQVGEK